MGYNPQKLKETWVPMAFTNFLGRPSITTIHISRIVPKRVTCNLIRFPKRLFMYFLRRLATFYSESRLFFKGLFIGVLLYCRKGMAIHILIGIYSQKSKDYESHNIHLWYIYLHFPLFMWPFFTVHVGKYTCSMDDMGIDSIN